MATSSPLAPLFVSLFLLFISISATKTFTHVNRGKFGFQVVEFNAHYRILHITNQTTTSFHLCFYNTAPNAFYLGLLAGDFRFDSVRPPVRPRWVWEANRGRPVGENAALSLLPDGNLVLTEADRSVVWSTGTANKDVVGLDILPNGNIVLVDSRGGFIWQSFEHPTDTLLVGQSLRVGGKLVSRASAIDGSFGAYSFVMESEGFTMYIDGVSNKPLPYYNYSDGVFGLAGKFSSAMLEFAPAYGVYQLSLTVSTDLGPDLPNVVRFIVGRIKYNATFSFLRLEVDGNLVSYSYYEPADYDMWDRPFAFFDDEIGRVSGCALPSKCGVLGVCEHGMCVGCPATKGRVEWDKGCSLPARPACAGRKVAVDYYKVVGVENFLSNYVKGEGGVKVEECKRRCSLDCKCVGFMYSEMESKCWLAPLMGTLVKVSNSSHVAYIKV